MIQSIRKNLKVSISPRHLIAQFAGAAPFILALALMIATKSPTTTPTTAWIKYLVQHQDDIIQSLIVSSVMVAIFLALLRSKVATFTAGFQPVVIQAMFIITDSTRHIALSLPIVAITVLPLLILLITLRREIDQLYDREG